MTEKIKLPVHVGTGAFAGIVYDHAGNPVSWDVIAAALNATGRRCDGCAHWRVIDDDDRWGTPGTVGRCGHPTFGTDEDCVRWAIRDADDCCRKGWEPKDA